MVATTEPQVITAGDSAQWEKTLADYPADDGWVLSYVFINATHKITFAGTADGASHFISLTAATTAAWNAGLYQWQAYATKAATSERATVESGSITIKPNLAAVGTTTYDGRSHARKVLDAIEAVIENRATTDQQEYTIGDRSLKRTPLADLYKLRTQYKAIVTKEETLENAGTGKPSRRKTLIRMR